MNFASSRSKLGSFIRAWRITTPGRLSQEPLNTSDTSDKVSISGCGLNTLNTRVDKSSTTGCLPDTSDKVSTSGCGLNTLSNLELERTPEAVAVSGINGRGDYEVPSTPSNAGIPQTNFWGADHQ